MIVEVLRFSIEPESLEEWKRVDADTWTAFLLVQPGFIRKEVWQGTDDDVRVVVWWRSQEDWDAITQQQVAEVDAQMGEWFRPSTLETFVVA